MNLLRACRTEECVLPEEKTFVVQKLGTQRKLLNISVIIQGKSDEKEKMWAGNGLRLFWCLMEGEGEREKLAFVWYMMCMPSLAEAYETVRRCVCRKRMRVLRRKT